MAKAKELFNVKGAMLTAHEKAVYEAVKEKGLVSYNDLIAVCGGGESGKKSAIATLARLEKTHGLLKKNEPVKVCTYEVATDVNEDVEQTSFFCQFTHEHMFALH